ncbi:hypothetical protein SteCoe_20902 [Stentor coeruleus]|uniref:Proteasome alpha-type subunits domain-containing protein n=1 Tax=Stentor coeruleus TaxID=5963 RepID=A0A1R2BRD3_9CILI|nr:hypothetical protein SteCoe_20902 [Stentor coeruleus]
MLKSPYDTDCITWSPQGRLFQIEYAMEAIKQGSLCVGLKSNDYAILATLNRAPSKLAEYQQKLYEIDEHIGLCFSGLTADGRLICKYLRTEALNYKYTHGTNINPQRLVGKLSDKAQIKTQRHSKRPYGVGCLVIGLDENGPHVYETSPDANFYEYYAVAIGARCQSAKTYLEKNYETFSNLSKDELIIHAVKAVKSSAQSDVELNGRSVSVAIVGRDTPFKFLTSDEIEATLSQLSQAMEVEV